MRGKREKESWNKEKMRAYFGADRVFGMNIRTETEPMILCSVWFQLETENLIQGTGLNLQFWFGSSCPKSQPYFKYILHMHLKVYLFLISLFKLNDSDELFVFILALYLTFIILISIISFRKRG